MTANRKATKHLRPGTGVGRDGADAEAVTSPQTVHEAKAGGKGLDAKARRTKFTAHGRPAMTHRLRARLAWIVEFERRCGRTPKLREMAHAWCVSVEAARLVVVRLIERGFVDRGLPDRICLRVLPAAREAA